ncbi:nucleotidyltransferase family protein [uncultured Devosia sp.]|uniref:nucleotidyltransferase family protein n=1 Tax=uncultured Devosia sp. TaxID=211434 RepID=UPI0026152C1C|nr:nucleotidyltransferase family protein [uncultured Devosia sp.]
MSERALGPEASLLDAVTAIEQSRRRLAVIVDGQQHVLGTITDGDVRRALLRGATMNVAAKMLMNATPVVVRPGWREQDIVRALKERNVLAAPVVDGEGRFLRIVHLTDLGYQDDMAFHETPIKTAVIMAGGEGRRLRPLTETIPKPMVEVGEMPVLERQVRRLKSSGIERILMSVNYLSEQIERHFGDGAAFGVSIEYLRETTPLGTAGPLSLVEVGGSMIVMNGDLVTSCDFGSLAQFHAQEGAALTVATVDHIVKIPFGVLSTRLDGQVTAIEEKPSQRFLCNAGIYVLSEEAVSRVPTRNFYNMTDLMEECIAANLKVIAYPLHEFWSDIGTLDDLERVRALFGQKEN